MLVNKESTLYLPQRAYSTDKYGSIGRTVTERSVHVEGHHEIGVSGEAISLLTPSPCQRMAFTPPSICRGNPSTLSTVPLDCNQSNYYSLLVPVAESERPFFSSATIMYGLDGGQETRELKVTPSGRGLIEATVFTETVVRLQILNDCGQLK